jgi:hypothetical protein
VNPGSTGFAVWLWNGSRWYPDPTYPGATVCSGGTSGQTILWAGKLDYWLIGGAQSGDQAGICRFDGVNYQWDKLVFPAASLSRVPAADQAGFTLNAGACFSWDNCWFFGKYGVVDHWDGQTLSDASSGLGDSSWLQSRFTSAAAGVDGAGDAFGLAVSAAGAGQDPGGCAAPEAFASSGGAFSPLVQNPLGTAPASCPSSAPPDLDAVAAGSNDGGWVAGDPAGANLNTEFSPAGPAPLLPIASSGAPCPGYGPADFGYLQGSSSGSFLWNSVSVYPGTAGSGTALAGGQYTSTGAEPQNEPVLVTAGCGASPGEVLFRAASSSTAPVDAAGYVTAVAANASNDAWAATSAGIVGQNPQLYHLQDQNPPDAPAGDDNEVRPLVFQIDPPIYVQSPGVIPPAPATSTTTTTTTTTTKKVKAKPAIYDQRAGKPVVGRGGRITLTITFKVRTAVTIGLEGILRHKVVSSTGLRHFKPGSGRLTLVLSRKRWPSRLAFITPPVRKHATDIVSGPIELTWIARIPA